MKTEKVLLGYVAVDSGMLIVTDPCYLKMFNNNEGSIEKTPDGEYSYLGCCKATLSPDQGGQLMFETGNDGAGVAFSTGVGDGYYPVYAEYVESWGRRIGRITIEFFEE